MVYSEDSCIIFIVLPYHFVIRCTLGRMGLVVVHKPIMPWYLLDILQVAASLIGSSGTHVRLQRKRD